MFETSVIIDAMLGAVVSLFLFIIKRIFSNIDRLSNRISQTDKSLNELAVQSISRSELDTQTDRILDRINALETRLLQK
ncbi:MAG TPA: hypothetical protein DG048_04880 [Pseudoalteromonas sp.]|nr:hypothetical protein [Pseudoalteromonas sp.]|tara:strand:+ start:164 stop:400 length:237 start_codon:yes stop_codon:yes gene_type:complete